MQLMHAFLQRYTALYDVWLAGIWDTVPEDLLLQRPHPRVNSIAWNLWHLTRVEDAGLNRFVVDRAQVFDDGPWLERLHVPWRHHGSEMTFAEVDELNQRIDVAALHAYSDAVQVRTRDIIHHLDPNRLDEVMGEDRLHTILFNEGLAHPRAAGLLDNYRGWTKGQCLMTFGLTHPFQHVGEMGVIASLLGIEFA